MFGIFDALFRATELCVLGHERDRLIRDFGLRGAEIVELCLEDIDSRAGTLVVRDERLGATSGSSLNT